MNEIDPNAALGSADGAASAQAAESRQTAAADTPNREPDRDTVRVEALLKATASRIVTDEATRVVQVEILDPVTRKVLRAIPDDDWLKVVRALQAMAGEAIVDKKT
ncbi:flagellar protein FlaG [Solidesulfovibrio sp.]|uniref:flagellar protein FlaG n=1 Tax=Solidesulfovibrio sp. TaxID=2910990 RepID=UPI0026325273|nr:flagellar protein FlaG [Solidesulfovibrio sp.]